MPYPAEEEQKYRSGGRGERREETREQEQQKIS
jgi:hypothetical protein